MTLNVPISSHSRGTRGSIPIPTHSHPFPAQHLNYIPIFPTSLFPFSLPAITIRRILKSREMVMHSKQKLPSYTSSTIYHHTSSLFFIIIFNYLSLVSQCQ